MAYVPTEWKDEVPESTPLLYTIKTAGGAIIEDDVIIELKTPVTAGTPVNATNLNKIEQGIADALPNIFEAKGDIIVGRGAGDAVRLAVGATGRMLMADSSQAAGVRWSGVRVFATAVNIPDNGVYSFDPKQVVSTGGNGILMIGVPAFVSLEMAGIFQFAVALSMIVPMAPTPIATAVGALTGTTGVDGKFTVSASSSLIYLENRLGQSTGVNIFALGTT